MKFEKIGEGYYVNSNRLKKDAFHEIFGEIWDADNFEKVLAVMQKGEVATVVFSGETLTNVGKLKRELQKERAKNARLEKKLMQLKIKAAEYDCLISAMKTA